MAPERSTPEEIPHVSTLALSTLEALLGQQEECSRTTLQSALAKKQDAKRLIAQASRAEGKAQSLHVHYEQTEAAIRALRTLVAEKNAQILEGRFEDTNRCRTLGKRSDVSDAPNAKAIAQADFENSLLTRCRIRHASEWRAEWRSNLSPLTTNTSHPTIMLELLAIDIRPSFFAQKQTTSYSHVVVLRHARLSHTLSDTTRCDTPTIPQE